MTGTKLFADLAVTFTGMIADNRRFDRRVFLSKEFQQFETDPIPKEDIHEYHIGLGLLNDVNGFVVRTGLEYDTDIFDFLQETDNFIDNPYGVVY